jgi:hypothetical protein
MATVLVAVASRRHDLAQANYNYWKRSVHCTAPRPIYHNHEISKKIKSLLTNFVVILKTPESFTNMEHLWNTNQASFAVNAYKQENAETGACKLCIDAL